MSIFIERSRIDRIELEDPATAIAGSGKKGRGWSTGRPGLDSLILQNGSRYNVDPYLIFLVMEQESHFNTHAVSPKGARGLMQLMPGTAARFGVRRAHDAAQNISGGTRYLRELLNRFNNRVDLVLASYNAGEGAVAKFGQRVPPYRETRNYVKKIGYRYKRTTARTKRPATENAKSAGGQ
jgi:soluble lytic murein transglycosylase-like protein